MSYLIKSGSLDNFSIRPTATEFADYEMSKLLVKHKDVLSNIKSYSALEQMSRSLAKESIPFVPEALTKFGGLGLESFTLYKGFEGIMNLFNPQNEIFFVAWTWDLSGNEPYVYPGKDIEPGQWVSPVKKDDTVKFIGNGLNLYPKQEIKGGVGVHIEVWESDSDVRKAGETIKEVTSKIQESKLTQILTGIASANPTTATITAISQAVLELSNIIGDVLSKNSDDYVNLFEGYYDVDSWTIGRDEYKNPVNDPICEIVLNKF